MQVLSRDFANQLGVLQRELLTVVSELRTQMSEMTARVTAVEANGQAVSQSMPPDGPLEDPALAGRRATDRAHFRLTSRPRTDAMLRLVNPRPTTSRRRTTQMRISVTLDASGLTWRKP